MSDKEYFDNNCFLPCWTEAQPKFVPHQKDLATLLAEMEEIKNYIEEIKDREWHLGKLMKFYKIGLSN